MQWALGDGEHQPVDAFGHGERRGAGQGDGRVRGGIGQHQRRQHRRDSAVAETGLHHVPQNKHQAAPGRPDDVQVRCGGKREVDQHDAADVGEQEKHGAGYLMEG
ncbi:hypothetical protein D3C80_1649780 [compost metagenome]